MEKQLKKESIVEILFYTFITAGIYIPFWFKKIYKIFNKSLSNHLFYPFLILGIINFLIILRPFVYIPLPINNYEILFNEIFRTLFFILNIKISFDLKNIIEEKFNIKLSSIKVFFFSVLYFVLTFQKLNNKEEYVNTDNISLNTEGVERKVVSDKKIKSLFIGINLFLLPLIAGLVVMLYYILSSIYSLIRTGSAGDGIWFVFLAPIFITLAIGVFILTIYVNRNILRFKKDGDQKYFIKRIIIPIALVLILYLIYFIPIALQELGLQS
jgi:hypothetical protein